MPKINILDKHVAELIAAGEVVERPSSVVKELLENSIDAGATNITVEIKNGGTTFIRVSDNGCGISREDVPKAFLRHATSKVKSQDDLDAISTLGFRGEALASICAVSRVKILTRTKQDIAGTEYIIMGGEEKSYDDAGCPEGTTIIIKDLFYNTPARMKFLKKDVSEGNSVAGVIDRIALSHPDVSFKFIRDSKECLNTPGDGNLKSAIYSIYGRDFTSSLIPVCYQLNGVNIDGFISKPTSARPNRSMQHFFINGRYVKTRTAMVALEEAFKGSIMVGKFPACVMNIGVSFDTVDVNVHPAKIEVRFINEKPIFDAVYHGVKTALLTGDRKPEMTLEHKKAEEPVINDDISNKYKRDIKNSIDSFLTSNNTSTRVSSIEQSSKQYKYDTPEVFIPKSNNNYNNVKLNDSSNAYKIYNTFEKQSSSDSNVDASLSTPSGLLANKQDNEENIETMPTIEQIVDEKQERSKELSVFEQIREKESNNVIGEIFNTYIMVEHGKDELMLIDKHAAHERMIYEELKEKTGKSCSQFLLEPITVTLDKNEYSAILDNSDRLFEAGFEIDDFGQGVVVVRAAPVYIAGDDIKSSIIEIAGYILENRKDITTEHMDWIYHNVACRAAIKAGQKSDNQELVDMVIKLEKNQEIRYCPHGRPVSIIIKKKEIEKQFGRV